MGHTPREIWEVTLNGQTEVACATGLSSITAGHIERTPVASTVPTYIPYFRKDGAVAYVWCSDPTETTDVVYLFLYGLS